MADGDLSTQFEKISDKAKAAADKLKAANERTRDQLESDVASARESADAAADRLKAKADDARDTASSHWQQLRGKWQAHVAEVRARADRAKAKVDADGAAMDADLTEAYATMRSISRWTRVMCSTPCTHEQGGGGTGKSLIERVSTIERHDLGRGRRSVLPRSALAEFVAAPDRPDPVAMLESQADSRIVDLVPVRYGRMLASPFAFFRGAALIMASDLAASGHTGITVQLCGDAHMSNFGLFASPERSLVFDINDFDETLPGPWEWDVKRLVASLAVAGRTNGFGRAERERVVRACAKAYRDRMRTLAAMRELDVWYAHTVIDDDVEARVDPNSRKRSAARRRRRTRATTCRRCRS